MPLRDVLIVGGGPSGLATAIAVGRLGLDYLVIEKGTVVDSIYRFPTHMVFFTTPELLEIGGLPLITPYEKPTRLEALRYYRRVVDAFQLQVALREEVVSIEREAEAFHARVREGYRALVAREPRMRLVDGTQSPEAVTRMILDAILADTPLLGGVEPKLGDQHLRVLTILGFPNATVPGILDPRFFAGQEVEIAGVLRAPPPAAAPRDSRTECAGASKARPGP